MATPAPLTITLAEDPATSTTVAPPAPTDSGKKPAPAAKPSLWGRFAGALSAVPRRDLLRALVALESASPLR